MPPPDVTFAADRMLGKLAKWLRIIGQDVIYGQHLSGYSLIRAARRECRVILTRDRSLYRKHPPECVFIEDDDFRRQLLQVVTAYELPWQRDLFRRCLACNSLLQPRSGEAVKRLVPPYVFSTQQNFSWCAGCRRVYWPATHHQNMLEELQRLGLK